MTGILFLDYPDRALSTEFSGFTSDPPAAAVYADKLFLAGRHHMTSFDYEEQRWSSQPVPLPQDFESHAAASLAVFERAYGPDHYEVAVNLNNLGVVWQAKGDAEQAERLLRRSLVIKERMFGAENVEWAMTANNHGTLLGELGRYEEAAEPRARARWRPSGALTPDHPSLVACRDNYAALRPAMCLPA